jgi:hypothetical protein
MSFKIAAVSDMHEQDAALVRLRRSPAKDVSSMTLATAVILLCIVTGYFIGDVAGASLGFILGAVMATVFYCVVRRRRTVGSNTEFLSIPRYRRIRSWYRWSALFVLFWFVGSITYLATIHDDFVFWYLTLCGLPMLAICAIGQVFIAALRDWHCPSCDKPFPQRGVFAGYPHVCRHCGFSIDREPKSKDKPSSDRLIA